MWLLLLLAGPVAIARVSNLTMGLVDTWMVGRLGAAELAGVALADACFFTFMVFTVGIVRALDPLISQAHGAGDPKRCAASWRGGLRLGLLLSAPLMALLLFGMGPILAALGQDPLVVKHAQAYLVPIAFGVPAQLLYVANACLIQSLGDTRPPMVIALFANLLNVFLDYALIFGNFGFPELGVVGSGIASAACRWFMCLLLFAWILFGSRYAPYRVRVPVPSRLYAQFLRLGVPIGLSHAFEVGAFALASIFLGWISREALAAHQIAIKMSATAFMVAVAIGVATSIRVGNGIGAGQPEGAQRSAWAGVGIGLVVMAFSGIWFWQGGRWIVSSFTADPEVIAIGAGLMAVAAAFQLTDGIQAIASGALRGAGDTLMPMTAQILAHWGIGIPCAYYFTFTLGWGPVGVWWGLALGLTLAAAFLLIPMARIRSRAAIKRD
ncbi:MAG: MATE family efflux transporter [Planctomycetes bacterium]|nr:MATE family efflux transporter [Planctomycetota bacterium]